MRRDHDPNVSWNRLQSNGHAERIESRQPRGGWLGGAPILAIGRNQMFARFEILPLFDVYPDMLARVH